MSSNFRYLAILASLALLLYLYIPAHAEKSDLSTAESNAGVRYTGTKMDRGNVRIDRSLSEAGIILRLPRTRGVQIIHEQINVIKKNLKGKCTFLFIIKEFCFTRHILRSTYHYTNEV